MWPIVQLGELCDNILSGGTPSTESPEFWNNEIPWLSSADILDHKHYIIRKGVSKLWKPNILPKNNIIVVTRVGLGKVIINNEDVCFSQDLQGLVLKSTIVDRRYLLYALLNKLTIFKQISRGATIKGVTRNDLISLQIPLPPLPIQQQIADTLDKADAMRRKDQELLDKYDELAEAVFYEMFGDPVKNEKGWESIKMDIACNKVTDGTHDTPERLKRGMPFITGKHIRAGFIDYDKCDYVDEKVHSEIFKRCNPEIGDVLYTNIGVNFGTAALNTVSYEFSMKNVALLKPNPKYINGEFLEALLNNPKYKLNILNSMGLGGAQQFLSLKQIRSISILIPPLYLQTDYATLLTKIKCNTLNVKNTTRHSNQLFGTLLMKYFNS